MTRKSQPNPPPQNDYAARLRQVREAHGEDIKTFHARVKNAGDLKVSYAAARHYDFDRVAPPDYFVAVAKEYPVRLDWLLTGEGPWTELEAKMIEAVASADDAYEMAWQALERAEKRIRAPFRLSDLDDVNQVVWLGLAVRFLRGGGERRFEDYTEDQILHALEPFVWLLSLPWIAVRTNQTRDTSLTPRLANTYFLAMYQVLNVALPQPGEGDTDASIKFLHSFKQALTERLWLEQKMEE